MESDDEYFESHIENIWDSYDICYQTRERISVSQISKAMENWFNKFGINKSRNGNESNFSWCWLNQIWKIGCANIRTLLSIKIYSNLLPWVFQFDSPSQWWLVNRFNIIRLVHSHCHFQFHTDLNYHRKHLLLTQRLYPEGCVRLTKKNLH